MKSLLLLILKTENSVKTFRACQWSYFPISLCQLRDRRESNTMGDSSLNDVL